jgi:hypothetical protein
MWLRYRFHFASWLSLESFLEALRMLLPRMLLPRMLLPRMLLPRMLLPRMLLGQVSQEIIVLQKHGEDTRTFLCLVLLDRRVNYQEKDMRFKSLACEHFLPILF